MAGVEVPPQTWAERPPGQVGRYPSRTTNVQLRHPEAACLHVCQHRGELVLPFVGVDDPWLQFGDEYEPGEFTQAPEEAEVGSLGVDLDPVHAGEAEFGEHSREVDCP